MRHASATTLSRRQSLRFARPDRRKPPGQAIGSSDVQLIRHCHHLWRRCDGQGSKAKNDRGGQSDPELSSGTSALHACR